VYAIIVISVARSSIRTVSAKMMRVVFNPELEREETWVFGEAEIDNANGRLAKSSRSWVRMSI